MFLKLYTMMHETDDLDNNPVFRALQSEFLKLFKWVQQKRGIVCIPHASTISQVVIDQHFVEMHVLQPSPFLKDHYVRPGPDKDCCVVVEKNFLITLEGYPKPSRRVKILGEELGYNEKSESFRILLIDGPLVGERQSEIQALRLVMLKEFTVVECRDFLASCVEGDEVVPSLETELQRFKSTYMILSGFLDDAASRLRRIWTDKSNLCLTKLNVSLMGNTVLVKNINIAVEGCVLGAVHDVIWPAVCEYCLLEDSTFVKKCDTLREVGFSQQHFTPQSFELCDFTRVKRQLDRINMAVSPREKLTAMKLVLDNLSCAVSEHEATGPSTGCAGSSCLTSDDYISLLVLVIVKYGGKHLMSNFYYLDTFQMVSDPADSLSFTLVTFKAACKFISSVPAGQLQQPPPKKIDQPSLFPPMPCTSELENMPTKSRADIELERINHMLMTSARVIEEARKESTDFVSTSSSATLQGISSSPSTKSRSTRHDSTQRHAPLGDFLSSLKNDSMDRSQQSLNMATEARQYAQRNRQGSDWFSHDKPATAVVADEIPNESEPTVDSTELVLDLATSNTEESTSVSTQAQMIKPKCDSNQWYKHDQDGSQESKSPRTYREGEEYCKRDKTGSSSSWYKHEHEDDGDSNQQRPVTAGTANAARMRSESDQWFSHDGASDVSSTKRFSARPVSTEIHNVFHHASADK